MISNIFLKIIFSILVFSRYYDPPMQYCSRNSTPIQFRISSDMCIQGSCGKFGRCYQFFSGGNMFSTCTCFAGEFFKNPENKRAQITDRYTLELNQNWNGIWKACSGLLVIVSISFSKNEALTYTSEKHFFLLFRKSFLIWNFDLEWWNVLKEELHI